MNSNVIYRPYKTQAWLLVCTISVGMLALAGAGYCLAFSIGGFLYLAGTGIAFVWLTKVMYDLSKSAVFFEENGLRILGNGYLDYRYIPWEILEYATYARNYKGHLFVILSLNPINRKEAKNFANRGAISSRICIDDVVVIYMDILQDVSQLRKMIEDHVAHIDTY